MLKPLREGLNLLLIAMLAIPTSAIAESRIEEALVSVRAEIDRGLTDRIFTAAAFGWIQDGKVVAAEYRGSANSDSIFDIASLTKPIFTTSAVMHLAEKGLLKLSDPVWRHLPAWSGCSIRKTALCEWRAAIRIEDLMRHQSGLKDAAARPGDVSFIRKIQAALKANRTWQTTLPMVFPSAPPGKIFQYQDVNFVILLEVTRTVLAKAEPQVSMEQLMEREFFSPLGMKSTFAHDVPSERIAQVIPSLEELRAGVIHDPLARLMPETAGNAGLFTSLPDLLSFAEMLLGNGTLDGRTYFNPATVRSFGRAEGPGRRGVGWDVLSEYSVSLRGKFTSGYGHSGYTGTSVWIVPEKKVAFVLLTNRTYYSDDEFIRVQRRGRERDETQKRIQLLRRRIADLVHDAQSRDLKSSI